MAAANRSERWSEESVFSLENIGTVNSDEGYNQDETELSVTPLTEVNTNADQNEIEIIEYNVEIFIALVQEEPCLWNTSFRAYKDQTKKRNAWSNIAEKFGKDSKSYFIIQIYFNEKFLMFTIFINRSTQITIEFMY